MLVSTRGRYALRVMIDLAERDCGAYTPLRDIAGRQGISEKYLESIIRRLVDAGMVVGLRGKGGGYRLTRPAAQVTAGDVLRVTEHSLAPVACLGEGANPCPNMAECRTLPLWQGLGASIDAYFDGVTIADLARSVDAQSGV